LRLTIAVLATLALSAALNAGQQPDSPAPQPAKTHPGAPGPVPTTAHPVGPLRITLQDALALARKNDPSFHAALTDSGVAREDRTQARDTLLPSASFTTSALYTQPSAAGGVKFIANNAPHEYVSQGNVHEQLDLASIAGYRRAAALAAAAKARAEIASRGLVVTVVQDYFAAEAAEQKLESARRSAEEGDKFLQITKDLEKGGEVAHSDGIKAELQAQDRRRQLQEAQLAYLNSRLDLAVLLFPDFTDNFELADNLHASVPLPPREEFEELAARDNPDIRAALAAVKAAGYDVNSARAGYLPSIGLDYWYGIDAERYATYGETLSDGSRAKNLGSSAMASLTLPLWNWGLTQSRVRQAEMRREQSKLELSLAQRRLLAQMRSLYSEAETALNQQAGIERSAELAADSLRLTTLRYTHGESTVLEVVDAQSTSAQAHAAYQEGALRYRVALANLQTLTGVLTTP
jgi:outer membrane protein TolC